jgi:CBS domain-containing protein
MAANPTTIKTGTRVGDAVSLLAARKFSELPVVDAAGRPVGLVDVTDVVGLKTVAEKPTKIAKKSAKSRIQIFPAEGAA